MRIVRKIEAVFCPLMLVLSLFVILKLKILPAYGIQLLSSKKHISGEAY